MSSVILPAVSHSGNLDIHTPPYIFKGILLSIDLDHVDLAQLVGQQKRSTVRPRPCPPSRIARSPFSKRSTT